MKMDSWIGASTESGNEGASTMTTGDYTGGAIYATHGKNPFKVNISKVRPMLRVIKYAMDFDIARVDVEYSLS